VPNDFEAEGSWKRSPNDWMSRLRKQGRQFGSETEGNSMNITTMVRASQLFEPHPNLSDEINRNIVQSEIEGGVHLDDLPEGVVLGVETQNHVYTIVTGGDSELISGHPRYCPDPVQVRIAGSTWGGAILKIRFVGRGMCLEFNHPKYRTITTSPIVDIRTVDRPAALQRGVRALFG
jgi:hypothetical protein